MRALNRFRLMALAVSLSCCLLARESAQAVVITTPASFASPPAVIAGDLLETSATLTFQAGNFIHEGSDPPSALSNGVFPAFVGSSRAGVTTPESGSSLIYTFDTTLNNGGYEITSIVSSGGWADDGRDRQNITISYTTVDNPVLQLLTNIAFDPAGTYSSVTLTDSSGVLITGLKTLQLDFPNQENNHAGYGEFDVIGAGIIIPIPEPTTATLLGLGALGLCISRRRRRNSTATTFTATTHEN